LARPGHTYYEAEAICGCAVGTVKSRVSRARRRLAELLSVQIGADICTVAEFGCDDECVPA
jgi:RNA polymerase sigma-70 factor (ECF subfamily)